MKKNIGIIIAIIFFCLFVLYAAFETLKVVLGPSLVVTEPANLATVTDPFITVKGTVKRAAFISVDGRQVFADADGAFSAELLLPPGYSIIEVKVVDRFGKTVLKDLSLDYVAPAAATTTIPLETATTTATSTISH